MQMAASELARGHLVVEEEEEAEAAEGVQEDHLSSSNPTRYLSETVEFHSTNLRHKLSPLPSTSCATETKNGWHLTSRSSDSALQETWYNK